MIICGKIIGLNWSWNLWLWKGLPVAMYNSCLVPLIYSFFFNLANKELEKHAL
jgi:hypothetical protein